MVAQDTGVYSTLVTGTNTNWETLVCCDAFDAAAGDSRTLFTECCFSGGRGNRLFLADQAGASIREINKYPTGNLIAFRNIDSLDRFGVNRYALITSAGVFITANIGATPAVRWTALGRNPPANACGIKAAGPAANPRFIVQAGSCNGTDADQLWQFAGTSSTGMWQRIQPPGNTGGFGIFAVDKSDPVRFIASHINGNNVAMIVSADSGVTWQNLTALDALMTRNGEFRMSNRTGLNIRGNAVTNFMGYVQPSLVAISPFNGRVIVAGAADSGIFLSTDQGVTWTTITDNTGSSNRPVIPRPLVAHFAQEQATSAVYVGTRGRGVWKINYTE
jgi:hypothetical protein